MVAGTMSIVTMTAFLLFLLRVDDSCTDYLANSDNNGTDCMRCTGRQDCTTGTRGDGWHGRNGSSSDEDRTDDAHCLRVLVRDVFERRARIQKPRRRLCGRHRSYGQ